MPVAESVLAALVVGLASGVAPGPLLTVVLRESIAGGARAGMLVALAPLLTDAPVVIALFFLVAHFGDVSLLVAVVSIGGGLYLAYLAVESMTVGPVEETGHPASRTPLATGALTNLANPNLYIFWTTVGAALLVDAWHAGIAALIAFLVVFYTCLVGSKALIALAAGNARAFRTGTLWLWTNRILGALLAVFALRFLWTGLRALPT